MFQVNDKETGTTLSTNKKTLDDLRCIQNPVKYLRLIFLAKTVNSIQPLTISANHSVLDVLQGSQHTSDKAT